MPETSRHGDSITEPDISRPEHLAEGYRPIMACVGHWKEYEEALGGIYNIETVGSNVDFFADTLKMDLKGFKNGGKASYVISPTDERPKFTRRLFNCTTLVAVGRDAETGEEVSFMTHQTPEKFLYFKKEQFTKDLKSQLEEFKARCLPGSIDIVIAGGNLDDDKPDEYKRSLEVLDSVVQEECGFEPLIIAGPKEKFNADNVYLDTQNRRLYIVRPDPEVSPFHNKSFYLRDIDKMKDEWREEKRQKRKAREKIEIEENNN